MQYMIEAAGKQIGETLEAVLAAVRAEVRRKDTASDASYNFAKRLDALSGVIDSLDGLLMSYLMFTDGEKVQRSDW